MRNKAEQIVINITEEASLASLPCVGRLGESGRSFWRWTPDVTLTGSDVIVTSWNSQTAAPKYQLAHCYTSIPSTDAQTGSHFTWKTHWVNFNNWHIDFLSTTMKWVNIWQINDKEKNQLSVSVKIFPCNFSSSPSSSSVFISCYVLLKTT